MVVIDSDVFLVEFVFQRDKRYETNRAFLGAVREARPAVAIYTLMEVLGQLSFNLASQQLARWPIWLQASYGLIVLWPEMAEADTRSFFEREIYQQPLARMQSHRMAFSDALVLELAERGPEVSAFVTWNARHFRHKSRWRC